jgi:hypothetical protein
MKKILLSLLLLTINFLAMAQDKTEMADAMRSNGKIYTVVAVCLTILFGLFAYVIVVDRKIGKIEKNKN